MIKVKKFEENYFRGWFKNAVGDFSAKDLELSRRWFWAWLKKLNEYVPIKSGKGRDVLEIGCSIGGVSSLLVDRGFDVYASDVSKYAVEKARKLSPKIKFFIFDVQKGIPIKKKFDIIIAFEVVEHLEHPEKSIKNMYMSLKNNGTLVLSSPYPSKWVYQDPTHISVKYPDEWVLLMKKLGLKNVSFCKFSLLPFFYKINYRLHVIFPFSIPIPYINNPIFYIGNK